MHSHAGAWEREGKGAWDREWLGATRVARSTGTNVAGRVESRVEGRVESTKPHRLVPALLRGNACRLALLIATLGLALC